MHANKNITINFIYHKPNIPEKYLKTFIGYYLIGSIIVPGRTPLIRFIEMDLKELKRLAERLVERLAESQNFLKRRTIKEKVVEKVGETGEKTREKIISLIQENPKITTTKLAEKTGLSLKGIEWNIKSLKENGLLQRIGPDKGGYWKVSKK